MKVGVGGKVGGTWEAEEKGFFFFLVLPIAVFLEPIIEPIE